VPVAPKHALAWRIPNVTTSTLSRFLTLIRAPRQRLNVPPLPLHPQRQRPWWMPLVRFSRLADFATAIEPPR
jgi:hypothetical protein